VSAAMRRASRSSSDADGRSTSIGQHARSRQRSQPLELCLHALHRRVRLHLAVLSAASPRACTRQERCAVTARSLVCCAHGSTSRPALPEAWRDRTDLVLMFRAVDSVAPPPRHTSARKVRGLDRLLLLRREDGQCVRSSSARCRSATASSSHACGHCRHSSL